MGVFGLKQLGDWLMILLLSHMSSVNGDYKSISSFITTSVLTGLVLLIVTIIGTAKGIKKVFEDGKTGLKYRFWSMGIIGLLTALMGIVKAVFFDLAVFGISNITGAVGHGAPVYTIVNVLLGIGYTIITTIVGVIVQVNYKSVK